LFDNVLSNFFADIGETAIVMYANIAGMLVNIPLNALFIFGIPDNKYIKFGGWGIKGAAVASVISTAICFIILLRKFFGIKYKHKFGAVSERGFDKNIFVKLFRFGGQSGIELFLNISAFNFFVFIAGSVGVIEQSAINITFSWNLLAFLPLIGISIATTSLVGRNMGGRSVDGAVKAVHSSLKIGFGYMLGIAAIYLICPEILINLFRTPDAAAFQKVSNIAVLMLRLINIYILTDVLLTILAGALRGAGDTRYIMIASVLMHWFFLVIPTSLAVYVFKCDILIIWWIFIIFSIMLAGLYCFRFWSGKWKKIKVIETADAPNISHLSAEVLME